MKRTVTWLHLSDLHARLRDDWDADEISGKLIRDLRRLERQENLRPDFIFFTGDAAYGATEGEKMSEQFQRVRAFLDAVRHSYEPKISVRNIYMVPGNHDVDRGEITPDQTAWLRSSDRTLSDILIAIRDGKKQWRTWMDRLAQYRNFLTSYGLLHLQPEDPHLIWADAQEVGGVRVGIAGLNSAWSCADNHDKAKLWLGADWQIAHLKQRMGPVAFSFALIHHPGNWFTHYEDPAVTRRLRQEFEIVLHGHEHQDWLDVDGNRHLLLSAGACYDASWMANGYSFGRVDLDRFKGKVWLRQWDQTGRGWVARNIANKTRDGIWTLGLLPWINAAQNSAQAASDEVDMEDTSLAVPDETVEEHYTRRFCQHVIEQYDILELFGCDIPRELQRHQLSVAYVSLNLSPEKEGESLAGSQRGDSKKAIGSRKKPKTEQELVETGAPIENVLDGVVEATGRLMIRGPAGAGKSTLLRWCAIHAAQQVITAPSVFSKPSSIVNSSNPSPEWSRLKDANPIGHSDSWRWKIPLLIRLRDCPDGRLPAATEFPRFLAKHLSSPPTHWITSLLEGGRALVLLDGVDEIHRDVRPQLAEEISELIRTYPNCTYVVTTRPGAVERGWLQRSSFAEARVEPMSRSDREEFIEKWYRSAALELKNRPRPGEDLAQTAARLKVELTVQPELGVLASNPLLCAMICALYRERQERLPESPAELCEALVQMLLHRRERETPGLQDAHFLAVWRSLQYPQKKGLLAELAWHMVSGGESSIDQQSARRIVSNVLASTPGRDREEGAEVLQAIVERSGLLRPAGDNRLDFLHNTLKDYLAAGKAVESGDWEFLVEKADDPTWQPVVLFSLALAPESYSSNLVSRLLKRVPPVRRRHAHFSSLSKKRRAALAATNARDFFLVRCRSAARRLAPKLSSDIDILTERLFPPAYMQEAEALAQLGPRILQHGAAILFDSSWWTTQDARTAARCLRLLRLIGGPRAATAVTAIRKLPSLSSSLTGEWMLAASELTDSSLPWPFSRNSVWANQTRVSDLRPLAAFSSLKYLDLAGTRVSDLRPISGHRDLQTLDLSHTPVSDLAPLRNLRSLNALRLTGTRVSDIRPLSALPRLESLLLGATKVTDVRVLRRLRRLRTLDISHSRLRDITPLGRLRHLEFLVLWGAEIAEIAALVELPRLKGLDLSMTMVSDLAPVRSFTSLVELKLISTLVHDLRPLSALSGLETLLLDGSKVTNLEPLSGLKSLNRLDIDRTDVSDLTPLEGLPALETLFLQQIRLRDLTPLLQIPSLRSVFVTNGYVDVQEVASIQAQRPSIDIHIMRTR